MVSDLKLAAGYRASGLVLWPIAEMPAAGRGVRLPRVNLPAASAFVNPDSAHYGPRREPLDAADVPRPRRTVPLRQDVAGGALGRDAPRCRRSVARPSTCPAAAPGRDALDAGTVASGDRIKAGDRPRGPRRTMPLRRG
jgi:hypothetical protein